MFGEKRAGPDPRSHQNLSSNPEPVGHAPGSIPFCAQRSGYPRRSGFHRGQVHRAALPGHGQWSSSSLPCIPVLSSGYVGLQGNSLPGFHREAVPASMYQMYLKIFWSVAKFFFLMERRQGL